jgi:hypothetical protein
MLPAGRQHIESSNSKFNPPGSALRTGIYHRPHGPARTFVLIALVFPGFSSVREKTGKIPVIKAKVLVVGNLWFQEPLVPGTFGSRKLPSM